MVIENNDILAQPFIRSGILPYAHTQDQNNLWPTLEELIKSQKRLIILKGNPIDPSKYPWINSTNYFIPLDTKFGYSTVEQITNEGPNLDNILTSGAYEKLKQINACKASGGQTPECQNLLRPNKLFRFTHNITIGLAGDKNAAAQVNAKKVLLSRLTKIATILNQVPNFPSLDFVEVPNQEALDAINQFNGVGAYAGKPAWQPKQ